MTTGPVRRSGRDGGVTLIELIAVLAIFAMVALIGLQSLTGALKARTRLDDIAGENAALARTLTLLRADLGAAVPLTFMPPGTPAEPAVRVTSANATLAVSISVPVTRIGTPGDGMARVIWRHDPAARRLTRQVWSALTPADDTARGPNTTMLDDVDDFALRVMADADGAWSSDYGSDPARAPDRLPRAVETTIGTADHGALRVLVAF